ncbi:hypothetical protein [Bradyrhizobium liaoningense]|uniref:hypothetical protein n=1 Tax=Bradyrhizobium liaoningense TaxID=43992 RepID=UPI001BA69B34|nr:hypothetical protein [Bradyrhizobium liaoningense]MBR1170243.1 hypothetical protein [Bradyrhizobium liaoningense]
MGKIVKRLNALKVIKGGKAEVVKLVNVLTHQDIKEFLAKFAEAILVDQKRVNRLPHEEFHEFYDHDMWQRSRDGHVGALVELYATVDEMPESLLKKLTDLALAYKPKAINQSLLNQISDLATGAASPWLYETASLFFSELIRDVSRKDPDTLFKENPVAMMSKWFDYDDPIAIARDSECEYEGLLASHIKQESNKTRRALSKRSRSDFIEMLAGREFYEIYKSQRRGS